MSPAPIALFAYNRPAHIARVIDSLLHNPEAADSELYIFSDGASGPGCAAAVGAVRDHLRTIRGFRSIEIIEHDRNLGLAASIVGGVTQLCASHGRAIVLEDDVVVSPFFLRYLHEALGRYAQEERVLSVGCYMYPVGAPLPETFFLRLPDSWGWGVWQRSWDLYEPDGSALLAEIRRRGLERDFDFAGSYGFLQMLRDQVEGKNDSWAVRWYAKAFLLGGLTLYPGTSLTRNIGLDGSGVHGGVTSRFDVAVADRPILVARIPVEEDRAARAQIAAFFGRARIPEWRARLRSWISPAPGRPR